jgi:hypothetical protein
LNAVYEADSEAQLYMSWTWIAGWFERLGSQWIVLAAKDCADSPDYVAFFPLQLRTERGREGKFHNERERAVVILPATLVSFAIPSISAMLCVPSPTTNG